jgi:hypothetical protein
VLNLGNIALINFQNKIDNDITIKATPVIYKPIKSLLLITKASTIRIIPIIKKISERIISQDMDFKFKLF